MLVGSSKEALRVSLSLLSQWEKLKFRPLKLKDIRYITISPDISTIVPDFCQLARSFVLEMGCTYEALLLGTHSSVNASTSFSTPAHTPTHSRGNKPNTTFASPAPRGKQYLNMGLNPVKPDSSTTNKSLRTIPFVADQVDSPIEDMLFIDYDTKWNFSSDFPFLSFKNNDSAPPSTQDQENASPSSRRTRMASGSIRSRLLNKSQSSASNTDEAEVKSFQSKPASADPQTVQTDQPPTGPLLPSEATIASYFDSVVHNIERYFSKLTESNANVRVQSFVVYLIHPFPVPPFSDTVIQSLANEANSHTTQESQPCAPTRNSSQVKKLLNSTVYNLVNYVRCLYEGIQKVEEKVYLQSQKVFNQFTPVLLPFSIQEMLKIRSSPLLLKQYCLSLYSLTVRSSQTIRNASDSPQTQYQQIKQAVQRLEPIFMLRYHTNNDKKANSVTTEHKEGDKTSVDERIRAQEKTLESKQKSILSSKMEYIQQVENTDGSIPLESMHANARSVWPQFEAESAHNQQNQQNQQKTQDTTDEKQDTELDLNPQQVIHCCYALCDDGSSVIVTLCSPDGGYFESRTISLSIQNVNEKASEETPNQLPPSAMEHSLDPDDPDVDPSAWPLSMSYARNLVRVIYTVVVRLVENKYAPADHFRLSRAPSSENVQSTPRGHSGGQLNASVSPTASPNDISVPSSTIRCQAIVVGRLGVMTDAEISAWKEAQEKWMTFAPNEQNQVLVQWWVVVSLRISPHVQCHDTTGLWEWGEKNRASAQKKMHQSTGEMETTVNLEKNEGENQGQNTVIAPLSAKLVITHIRSSHRILHSTSISKNSTQNFTREEYPPVPLLLAYLFVPNYPTLYHKLVLPESASDQPPHPWLDCDAHSKLHPNILEECDDALYWDGTRKSVTNTPLEVHIFIILIIFYFHVFFSQLFILFLSSFSCIWPIDQFDHCLRLRKTTFFQHSQRS